MSDVQAGKAVTSILKPLEILTRPQLPRARQAAAAGGSSIAQALAGAPQTTAAGQPAANAQPGGSAAPEGSGSQAAQPAAAPAEVGAAPASLIRYAASTNCPI